MTSLRVRLFLVAAVTICATLAAGGLALTLIFERHIERRVAGELRQRWDELATVLASDPQGGPRLTRALSDPRYERPYSGSYWQLLDEDGQPRLRSRSLREDTLPITPAVSDESDEAVEETGPKDSEIYVIDRPLTLGDGKPRTYRLAVALDHAEINALRESFVGDIGIALTILGAILLTGAATQAAYGLRPLTLLRTQLAAIHGGRADRLTGRFPDEVAPLASDLNLLLDEQEKQMKAARERAGDLAHGLKTPLSVLGTEARRLEAIGHAQSAALLREQVGFMWAHVERELARTRTRGSVPTGGGTTPTAEAVGKLIGVLKRIEPGTDLAWTVEVHPGLLVQMDPHDFGEVMGNLLDNARKWARTTIVISARPAQGGFRIAVTDDGPGIVDEQRAKLTERGERGSPQVEGHGLGLSIVSGVLFAYGLRLSIGSGPQGGCAVSFVVDGWVSVQAAGAPRGPAVVRAS